MSEQYLSIPFRIPAEIHPGGVCVAVRFTFQFLSGFQSAQPPCALFYGPLLLSIPFRIPGGEDGPWSFEAGAWSFNSFPDSRNGENKTHTYTTHTTFQFLSGFQPPTWNTYWWRHMRSFQFLSGFQPTAIRRLFPLVFWTFNSFPDSSSIISFISVISISTFNSFPDSS